MRTILLALLYVILTIVSLPLLLIELLVRKINQKAAAKFALVVVKIVFCIVMFISGSKKTIIGKERIPKDSAVMYAANHRGFYDILLAYSTVPNQTAFVSKDALKKVPIISQWMYFLNCEFIDRKDLKQQLSVIISCIAKVKKGYSIYIAPEGTRNTKEELLPFKEGSFKIAHKTGCPIVPVCILNTEKAFEESLPWVKKAKIVIEFGEPVYLDELEPENKKHVGAYVQNIIADMYKKNLPLIK
jgi:1-acyl-sn-glycerol-3-phosphate acyltransferase